MAQSILRQINQLIEALLSLSLPLLGLILPIASLMDWHLGKNHNCIRIYVV